ncbi:MAG TPA: ATP-binding protein [Chitinophagaceae bacterium]|nr:ATP-binding protein [Chitinophagaceae bacterium]
MKKFLITIAYFIISVFNVSSQNRYTDSLHLLLERSSADTNRIKLLLGIAEVYYFSKPDSSLLYSDSAIKLSRELHSLKHEIDALSAAGESLRFLGDFPRALRMQMKALELARHTNDYDSEAASMGFIGFIYLEFKEYRLALSYLFPALKLSRQVKNQTLQSFVLTNIGNTYDLLKMHDSALYYQELAFKTYAGLRHGPLKSLILTRSGNAFFNLGQKDSALAYYYRALQNANAVNDRVNTAKIERKIAEVFESGFQHDSSLFYAKRSFIHGKQSMQRLELLETSKFLSAIFRKRQNTDSAFYYQDFAIAMTDSLYGPQKFKELQLLMLEEQERQQGIQQEQERYKNKTQKIALWSAIVIFLIIGFILYRNNYQKQKANKVLEKTLSDLRATQSQLIQSEKMASLGELTAGIAHEIQNPLNFVNNFSDVNKELLVEMNEEIEKGNLGDIKILAKDIIENEEKINHHGKRADAIVKGMLQHSRSSSGVKEPTDLNALADEYLRLAYHGLKAKNKSFNAKMQTNFDASIGKIKIVPHDVGRVVLNLINNAFYAVEEKKRHVSSGAAAPNGYEPTVSVSTKKANGKVEVRVKDNGNGIPQTVLDKIFQPFFTTKPAGQGTGLGLSLSYDIVKAHGGELLVETREREGTEFIVVLPIN